MPSSVYVLGLAACLPGWTVTTNIPLVLVRGAAKNDCSVERALVVIFFFFLEFIFQQWEEVRDLNR